jgi:hypothetical protein
MAENVCPPDHKHGGSSTCARHHHCKCSNCGDAAKRRQRNYRARRTVGRVNSIVPSLGTQRRIQALAANGWTLQHIGALAGSHRQHLSCILQSDHVTRAMRARIARIFDEMWDAFPPETDPKSRALVARSRRYAAAQGWRTALAWDDIDTDPEPAATERTDDVDEIAVELACRGENVKLTTREKEQVVTILHGKRLSDSAIAALLGCPPETPWRIRQRLNLPPNYDAAGELVAA